MKTIRSPSTVQAKDAALFIFKSLAKDLASIKAKKGA